MNQQLACDIADWQLKADKTLINIFSSEIKDMKKANELVGIINEARTLLLRATPIV